MSTPVPSLVGNRTDWASTKFASGSTMRSRSGIVQRVRQVLRPGCSAAIWGMTPAPAKATIAPPHPELNPIFIGQRLDSRHALVVAQQCKGVRDILLGDVCPLALVDR